MKELIKSLIADLHERRIPEIISRDIKVPLHTGKIVSLVGPRRAGKTFLMYQVMQQIPDITNIIYINFEDERIQLEAKSMQIIIDAYFEKYPNKKEKDLYFFFDEIQEIVGWEKFVRRVYDTISKNIFVTGSSSKLLSKEIATSLRGRTITYEVYPLSFNEFLRFKKVKANPDSTKGKANPDSTKGKAKLKKIFEEYLLLGGFPETIGMDEEVYQKTITNYFEVMLYRDIVERYEVTNVLPLKRMLKKVVANTAKDLSVNKIFNDFKSQKIKVSKDSLYRYLEYSEDAYLIFTLHQFSESAAKQVPKKSYTIDNGLSSLLSFTLSKDVGRLLENLVFLELKRRGETLFFYRDNTECDFVVQKNEKVSQVIQVCYELDDNNRGREFAGLKEAMKRFGLEKGTILTFDQAETLDGIEVIPVWRWLLEGVCKLRV